jgi:hypothetical protein
MFSELENMECIEFGRRETDGDFTKNIAKMTCEIIDYATNANLYTTIKPVQTVDYEQLIMAKIIDWGEMNLKEGGFEKIRLVYVLLFLCLW